MRLLICEDEEDILNGLAKGLRKLNYYVDTAMDGEEALSLYFESEYDLIILDLNMPKLDGLEVLKTIREDNAESKVIILSARDTLNDKVLGLDLGANDYLVKPFSFEELLARIRVMTREKHNLSENILNIADLCLNLSSHTVTRDGKEISLTSKEYQLLEYLMYNKEKVLSREKIENHIWNYDYEGGTNVIDVYIRYLRKKIDDGFDTKLIHTVRGAGYVIREDKD